MTQSLIDSLPLARTTVHTTVAAPLGDARHDVEATLHMLRAARTDYASVNERFAAPLIEAPGERGPVMIGASSLDELRFGTAAKAVEGALRVRELFMQDFAAGFAAQANSSRAAALYVLAE